MLNVVATTLQDSPPCVTRAKRRSAMNARSIPVIAAFLTLVLAGALPATAAGGTSYYYLALGDSLAQGVQPNTRGDSVVTNQGYVDDLYGLYRAEVAGLQLAKLGCPGETTTTMIHGGVCYPAGTSQLDRAVAFLRSHLVVLVTIDIGANNVLPCVGLSGIDTGCINQGVGEVSYDLPYILAQLRAAAGPGVPVVAMNYYDPFLAEWLQGPAGQALAKQSVQFTTFFNSVLAQIYAAARVPDADRPGARLTNAGPGGRSAETATGQHGQAHQTRAEQHEGGRLWDGGEDYWCREEAMEARAVREIPDDLAGRVDALGYREVDGSRRIDRGEGTGCVEEAMAIADRVVAESPDDLAGVVDALGCGAAGEGPRHIDRRESAGCVEEAMGARADVELSDDLAGRVDAEGEGAVGPRPIDRG